MRRSPRNMHTRGAALVEFIIALPVLMMLAFGIISFSLLQTRRAGVVAALQAGARELAGASSLSGLDEIACLRAAGTAFENTLDRYGVSREEVAIEANPSPWDTLHYLSGGPVVLTNDSGYATPRLYQLRVLYRPRCLICSLFGASFREALTRRIVEVVAVESTEGCSPAACTVPGEIPAYNSWGWVDCLASE